MQSVFNTPMAAYSFQKKLGILLHITNKIAGFNGGFVSNSSFANDANNAIQSGPVNCFINQGNRV